LHDRAAAGALAFDDLVHQLPAVPQAVGVAEQPGPARPGSNSAMLNGSVAGSPYSGLQRIGEPLRKLTEPFVAERSHGRLLALPGKPRLGGLAGALLGAGDRGRVVSSAAAISLAENPSTSRRMWTARCRAGRCCSAAMKASSTASRCS
jgi:hypothetical protein